MTAQCFVIVLIILAIAVCFVRAKRKRWAMSALPFAVVPAVNAIAERVFDMLGYHYSPFAATIWILAALVASCIWIGICTVFVFNRKGYRVWYVLIGVVYNLLLAIILLLHFYSLAAV